MNEFSDESNNTNDIPEFFLKRKKIMEEESKSSDKIDTINKKPEEKKPLKKSSNSLKSTKDEIAKNDETSLVDVDYNRKKLFSKGINLMADEKLEDASHIFQMILRINPNDVDALLKLGYARFHLEDYTESMRAYDKVLDIDVTNADAWNLKSLVYYERKS